MVQTPGIPMAFVAIWAMDVNNTPAAIGPQTQTWLSRQQPRSGCHPGPGYQAGHQYQPIPHLPRSFRTVSHHSTRHSVACFSFPPISPLCTCSSQWRRAGLGMPSGRLGCVDPGCPVGVFHLLEQHGIRWACIEYRFSNYVLVIF